MQSKLMLLAAGLVAPVAFLAGCNGSAPSLPTLTFQQASALVCADADTAVQIMKDDGVFTGGALDTLNQEYKPTLDKVCAAGATITKPNLQSLANVGLPLLKSLVDSSSLQQQMKNNAKAAIDLTELAINTAVALAPVSTAAPAAASAPVAASSAQ